MEIERLSLRNFRNYTRLDLPFRSGATLLYGPNAAGKTSILEAIALVVIVVVLFLQTWRASIIPLLAVPVSVVGTFAVLHLLGFSINVVSLLALSLVAGVLVDDAIVVVENIHRRAQIDHLPLAQVIPRAVDEVGGPTILATFTVIAALLPMAFVSGLMGPYMAPIPINSSMGMLLSLAIAFIVTPWMARLWMKALPAGTHAGHTGLSARLADAGTQLLLSAAMALREGPRTARDQWRLHASLSHPF